MNTRHLLPLAAAAILAPLAAADHCDQVIRFAGTGQTLVDLVDPAPSVGVTTVFGGSFGRHLLNAAPADQTILVRTTESIPPIEIDPSQRLDERDLERLRETYPYLQRTGDILHDLRVARNRWLRENGLIESVRSYGPRGVPAHNASPAAATTKDNAPDAAPKKNGGTLIIPEPRGILELRVEAGRAVIENATDHNADTLVRVHRTAVADAR